MITLALQVVAAFNLVCTGTELQGSLDSLHTVNEHPYSVTYRIDLDHGRWCQSSCTETEALGRVSETEIRLPIPYDADPRSGVIFNRESGRFTDMIIVGNATVFRSGQCERAAFTGFPTRQF